MLLDLVSKQVKEIDRVSSWPLNEILTPDKQYLTFRGWRENMETIFLLPVEGGKRRSVVKFKDQYMASFAWSPDAKKLYFARGTFQDGSTSLWFKDLETEEMIDLGLKISFMRELQLHPDGQTLVFQAAEVNFEIWAMEDF